MFFDQRPAVVVPCYNEQVLIRRVIETMPASGDRIFVVDDKSSDVTAGVVQEYVNKAPERIVLIRHAENQDVGGAIASGYKAALAERFDVTVVMAGDAQVDPAERSRVPAVRDVDRHCIQP
ncbi:glycosyltransferase [Thiohalocapsa sp. ML1]|uniref:glycosyltransferase n=1 Tax=Thiohalocapsa sp. ML1 TaxID=1431688 RepID=UPI0007320077|nr:glycosyltransferase [Thiohalocapsa sp. ML1]